MVAHLSHQTSSKEDNISNDKHIEQAPVTVRRIPLPDILADRTEEELVAMEHKLKRKIDLRLMPAVVLMYILNYIDRYVTSHNDPCVLCVSDVLYYRNNIAAARFAGLEKDLKLDANGTDFNTAVSILFVGYLLMQIPSNLFLNKLGKPAIYLPSCMIVWGIISAATAACQNIGGLLAVRFFLGIVEAACKLCLLLITSHITTY